MTRSGHRCDPERQRRRRFNNDVHPHNHAVVKNRPL